MRTISLALIFFFIEIQSTFAWGDKGHRIVGAIAETHLSAKAKKALKALMGSESLARASTWPDEVRSDPNREKYDVWTSWHYVEAPGDTLPENNSERVQNVLDAIPFVIQQLKNKDTTKLQKQEALRLLAHFVGDLHQPLHVGNGRDRGGNWCMVKWFGKPENLHAVWDTSLIEQANLSYTEYIDFISTMTESDKKKWRNSSVRDWAQESLKLRQNLYPPQPTSYCRTSADQKIAESAMPELGYAYHYTHRPTVELRLQQAGIRLASLLNQIYDSSTTSP